MRSLWGKRLFQEWPARKMTPSSSIYNVPNGSRIDAESFSKPHGKSPNWVLECLHNITHIPLGKPRITSFASKRTVMFVSFLGSTIPHVVGLRSKKQIRWSGAFRAIAFMKHVHPFRNRTIMENPTSDMSPNRCPSMSSHVNLSVSEFVFSGCPQPAPIGLDNLRPESLWERFGKSLRGQIFRSNFDYGHNNYRLLCSAPGRVNGSGVIRFQSKFSSFQSQGGLVL